MDLMDHQKDVLKRLSNGKILWGGVGSGKSIVALAYYMENEVGLENVYVITTAKKRDSLEWQRDAAKFGIGMDKDSTVAGVLHIDSWNNIGKYVDVKNAFFIFDEQRLVGGGAWVKAFYKIIKNNNAWLLLTATPGDTWMDFIPVFVANGFYKNKTEFVRRHVRYAPFSRFPKIIGYFDVDVLEQYKREVLVAMPYESHTIRKHEDVLVPYDIDLFKTASEKRWNVFEDKPIENVAELFAVLRRIVYSDPRRLDALRGLMEKHPRLIVFYTYNYELDRLRELYDSFSDLYEVAEWNGHVKNAIPTGENWVYIVQYTSGAEGWNCTSTDAMVFYSMTYSYKQFEQAQGRIDRLNTAYEHLYYYTLTSNSIVDRAVKKSILAKKDFNERAWAEENLPNF